MMTNTEDREADEEEMRCRHREERAAARPLTIAQIRALRVARDFGEDGWGEIDSQLDAREPIGARRLSYAMSARQRCMTFEALERRGLLVRHEEGARLTDAGRAALTALG